MDPALALVRMVGRRRARRGSAIRTRPERSGRGEGRAVAEAPAGGDHPRSRDGSDSARPSFRQARAPTCAVGPALGAVVPGGAGCRCRVLRGAGRWSGGGSQGRDRSPVGAASGPAFRRAGRVAARLGEQPRRDACAAGWCGRAVGRPGGYPGQIRCRKGHSAWSGGRRTPRGAAVAPVRARQWRH